MMMIFAIISVTLFLLFASQTIYIVRQQNIAVIERFGKYVGHGSAGLNFKLPSPISIIAKKVSLRITETEHTLGIKTKDNAFIKLPVKVQLRVLPERIEDAFYKLDNPVEQINSFILNIVRSKSSTLDLEDIFTKKSELAEHVSEVLKNKVYEYGYEIVDLLVDQPEPSMDVQDAYNRVISSKRGLDAAKNDAEAAKTLLIGQAEAEARSLELKAESYARQRKIITQGIREALEEVKNHEGDLGSRYILEFLAGIDYRDTIREVAKSNSNTLVFSNDPSKDLNKILPLAISDNLSEINNNKEHKCDAQKNSSNRKKVEDEVWE